MLRFVKLHVIWDWFDFGLMLRITKNNRISEYYFAIDLQFLWFNLWIQCWRKTKHKTNINKKKP